ncbi:hypothetical protein CO731_00696 [Aminobacter sp. MSH1]|uniref:DUF5681 domain-containing protein n=1 Tax=Aminobacter sp. MSH1 TaxID=374606 RepID=UPI000D504930|nr:DUF5681 domain-containing protein [Aminobacter sp. MSH1]AWC21247.1 hypothetical protein CO731_00696 [Aminobacter sp. MSH1]
MAKLADLSSDNEAAATGSVQSLAPAKVTVRHRARPVAALGNVSTNAVTRDSGNVVSDQAEVLSTLHDPANENREEVPDATPPPSYEVGYGRPPKKHQFEKGKSGNPKGRGKGNRNIKSMVRDLLNEKVTVTRDGKRKKIETREAVMQVVRNKALNGDLKALQFLIASAGETSTSGEEPVGAALATLVETDLAILAFHYRLALGGEGFDDEQIDKIFVVLGLPGASPVEIVSPEPVPPDSPSDATEVEQSTPLEILDLPSLAAPARTKPAVFDF